VNENFKKYTRETADSAQLNN